ncbi:hypothetical protein [Candidatus Chrysopegis kryptomonas]|uniref:Uncharacterized protein n=1 Tax=Candidatus Chryseopegocella kryptomonas TaxID=1633643 RepID=A0A0N7MY61_9BACT|nr:hypothetical protein [Candidatus Chrysopegis kryptomonas]CUT03347.1 hypothetical protein JGI23_01453 [Candidatus Chrysopegis kryptomonas]
MPLFIKKEREEETKAEEIITELKSSDSGEDEPKPEQTVSSETQKIKFKIDEKTQAKPPLGTITVKILANDIEFATFIIAPEIFKEASILLKEVISKIENPQLKLTTNCNCVWCKEKTTELENFLNS